MKFETFMIQTTSKLYHIILNHVTSSFDISYQYISYIIRLYNVITL